MTKLFKTVYLKKKTNFSLKNLFIWRVALLLNVCTLMVSENKISWNQTSARNSHIFTFKKTPHATRNTRNKGDENKIFPSNTNWVAVRSKARKESHWNSYSMMWGLLQLHSKWNVDSPRREAGAWNGPKREFSLYCCTEVAVPKAILLFGRLSFVAPEAIFRMVIGFYWLLVNFTSPTAFITTSGPLFVRISNRRIYSTLDRQPSFRLRF